MFHVELGPYGGDKVNILKAGGDYGWPDYGF
jgi:glucose/arabinose dehydrogenase